MTSSLPHLGSSPFTKLKNAAMLAVIVLMTSASVTLAAANDPPESADLVQPALIGSTAPDVTVRTIDGKSTQLHDLLLGKKSVLIFYRGGW